MNKQDKSVSYYEANKDILKAKRKLYIAKNKAKIKASTKAYYLNNKDKIDANNKQYNIDNKEAVSAMAKIYFQNNKQKMYDSNVKYIKNKCDNDPLYKFKVMVGSLPSNFCRLNRPYTKGAGRDIIGCSGAELIDYLNNNKYGFKYNPKKFDIDHIIPLNKGETKKQIAKLGHYTNLQLLPIKYNRYVKKNNLFDVNNLENWLKL